MRNNFKRIILIITVIATFCTIAWLFTDIIVYIFIALILSILGSPLVRLLRKIKIGNRQLPDSVAASITLLVIVTILSTIFLLFTPLVSHQIRQLQNFDLSFIAQNFSAFTQNIDNWLHSKNLITNDFCISNVLLNQISEFAASLHLSAFFGDIVSAAGTLFVCIFSVIFMTYFALKDNAIFWTMIKKMIPFSLRNNFDNILSETKKQLRRYFTGVFAEMIIVGTLDGVICFLLGVPNALLIGVVAGLLNIIPYVGPLIAGGIAVIIGLTPTLIAGDVIIAPTFIKIIATFVSVKLLDDFILQPNIYGKSVNSHPLEIFLVILVAGKVGGIWGMMFGVPAYTLLRIVIKEFFAPYFMPNKYDNNISKTTD